MDSAQSSSRIRLLREKLGASQSAFASGLGLPRTTLINYEKGTSVPAETLAKLREAYKLNVDWFLTGEGPMFLEPPEASETDSKFATVANLPAEQDAFKSVTVTDLDDEQNSHKNDTVTYLDTPPEPSERPLPSRKAILAAARKRAAEEDMVQGYGPPPSQGAVQAETSLPAVSGERDPDSPPRRFKDWGFMRDVTAYKYRKGQTEPIEVVGPDPTGVVFVPIYNQTVAAGPGQPETQLIDTEYMMPVIQDLFGMHRPENCGIVRVVGDSMTDITLSNGDWVIFDRHDIKGDGIFVISMFGEMRVKRLQYRLAERLVVIASENTRRYPEPETVSVELIGRDLWIHGRVFSWLHKHPY